MALKSFVVARSMIQHAAFIHSLATGASEVAHMSFSRSRSRTPAPSLMVTSENGCVEAELHTSQRELFHSLPSYGVCRPTLTSEKQDANRAMPRLCSSPTLSIQRKLTSLFDPLVIIATRALTAFVREMQRVQLVSA